MIIFSNQRLGPASELLVSRPVAEEMLRATAAAASQVADARWEHELVSWLEERARADLSLDLSIDVGDIAWTPENFERQRRFLLAAILKATEGSEHARAFERWARMIEAHPRESIQYGKRWAWRPTA
ncbi:MAG: hypothetical protein ACTHU0_25450 [Kofleriaceae bacterium]